MSFVKYRVKEVAADFGVTPKDIAEIVGKYFEKPRSNTQVLTDEQLNVVFDVITQKHSPIDSPAAQSSAAGNAYLDGLIRTPPARPAGCDSASPPPESFDWQWTVFRP